MYPQGGRRRPCSRICVRAMPAKVSGPGRHISTPTNPGLEFKSLRIRPREGFELKNGPVMPIQGFSKYGVRMSESHQQRGQTHGSHLKPQKAMPVPGVAIVLHIPLSWPPPRPLFQATGSDETFVMFLVWKPRSDY